MIKDILVKRKNALIWVLAIITVITALFYINANKSNQNDFAFAESSKADTGIVNDNIVKLSFVYKGEEKEVGSLPITVGEFFNSKGIEIEKDDIVKPSLDTVINEDTKIVYKDVEYKVKTKKKDIKYKTKTVKDSSLTKGKKVVVTEGKKGQKSVTYKIKYIDGKYQENEVLKSKTLKKPVTKVVKVGTKVPTGTFRGQAYSKKISVKAYAYHEYEGARGAYGGLCRRGTIAVDPRVIPLGSRVYVEGYGYAIANDTGGMIKGNVIDVYMDSQSQCYSWGIKYLKVYVLK